MSVTWGAPRLGSDEKTERGWKTVARPRAVPIQTTPAPSTTTSRTSPLGRPVWPSPTPRYWRARSSAGEAGSAPVSHTITPATPTVIHFWPAGSTAMVERPWPPDVPDGNGRPAKVPSLSKRWSGSGASRLAIQRRSRSKATPEMLTKELFVGSAERSDELVSS